MTTPSFKTWYDRVTNLFFDENHVVQTVDADIKGDVAELIVVVGWQASWWEPPSAKSKRVSMDATQQWTVRRSAKNAARARDRRVQRDLQALRLRARLRAAIARQEPRREDTMTKVLNMAGEAGDRRWAIFERFIAQGLVKGQFPILDEVEMEELTDHQDYGPGYPPGRNGVRALTSALLQAFPDMQSDIEEIIAAGSETWARVRSTGTFLGALPGHPADRQADRHLRRRVGALDRR